MQLPTLPLQRPHTSFFKKKKIENILLKVIRPLFIQRCHEKLKKYIYEQKTLLAGPFDCPLVIVFVYLSSLAFCLNYWKYQGSKTTKIIEEYPSSKIIEKYGRCRTSKVHNTQISCVGGFGVININLKIIEFSFCYIARSEGAQDTFS